MVVKLPALPYEENALEPYTSAMTLSFHYGKHHKAYVDNTNKMIAGTDLENAPLEQIILTAAKDPSKAGLFNNSAQVWNHDFFWKCMKPNGGGQPTGEIARRIQEAFGDYAKFAEQFKTAAVGRFGSGWAWLVEEGGALKVINTLNADTPLAHGQKALLTCDVWEHAYYLDYQNRRPDFVQAFIDHLINWDFVEANLKG
jgi:Fe-Mn family superoxide dismutase